MALETIGKEFVEAGAGYTQIGRINLNSGRTYTLIFTADASDPDQIFSTWQVAVTYSYQAGFSLALDLPPQFEYPDFPVGISTRIPSTWVNTAEAVFFVARRELYKSFSNVASTEVTLEIDPDIFIATL